jgi:hypothetical protein
MMAAGMGATLLVVASTAVMMRGDANGPGSRLGSLDAGRIALFPVEQEVVTTATLPWSAELTATERLRGAFERWRGVTIVAARSPAGTDPATSARALGAGRYVRTFTSQRAAQASVRATLLDAQSDSVIAERRVTISPAGDLDSAITLLADALLFPGDPLPNRVEEQPGTESWRARLAYLDGHRAIVNWDLAEADSAFARATHEDPDYAQAFLWMAQVRTWMKETPTRWRFAVEQAVRDSSRIAPRDRLLANALAAFARGDVTSACARWGRLTELDRGDFAAWYGLGTCLRSDAAVVRDPRSPSGWSFRTSYRAVLQAYERAFQLLPATHRSFRGGSFEDVQKLLMTQSNALRLGRALLPDTTRFVAYPSWNNDTLSFIPVPEGEFSAPATPSRARAQNAAIRQQRQRFYEIATMWRAAYPRSAPAMEAVAVALDLLGNASAFDTLRIARQLARADDDRLRMATFEVWMRLKFAAPTDVQGIIRTRFLADSILNAHRARDPQEAKLLASLAALLGRANDAAALARSAEARNAPPAIAQTAPALMAFAAMGGPADSLRILERRVRQGIEDGMLDQDRAGARAGWLMRAAFLAIPDYRFESMPSATGSTSLRGSLLAAWLARDTTRARELLLTLRDSRRDARIHAFDLTTDGVFQEASILASLGDTRGALQWVAPTLDSLAFAAPQTFTTVANAGSLVRAMVLRAELSAALGDSRDSQEWAGVVAELWRKPDPYLENSLQRMKQLARRIPR